MDLTMFLVPAVARRPLPSNGFCSRAITLATKVAYVKDASLVGSSTKFRLFTCAYFCITKLTTKCLLYAKRRKDGVGLAKGRNNSLSELCIVSFVFVGDQQCILISTVQAY